jgi:HAE1 family hydrophobic/amphiphilic exporter-1
MAHRGVIATLTVLVFLSSVPLFRFVNINFTTQDDQSGFDLTVRAPEGTSLDATQVLADRIATAIRRIPEVGYTLVTVAGDGAGTQNNASIFVKLVPIEARRRDQFDIMAEVRTDILKPYADRGFRVNVGGGGFGGSGVQYVLQGPEIAGLQRYGDELLKKVKGHSRRCGCRHVAQQRKAELSIRMDRAKAADLGVQLSDAAEALRLLVGGDAVTTYNEVR